MKPQLNPQLSPIGTATARFVASAGEREFPPEVLEMAKMCLVDWFAVALGAINEPTAVAVRAAGDAMATRGGARLVMHGTAAPAVAALVNGTTAHCLDFDDTHQTGGSHLSSPTWATVLAMAGARGSSETEALAAFVTGYEVGARLAGTEMAPALHYRGFHPTAIFGRFSSAAACCALLGLDAERAAHALGLAATQAGGLNASFGTMAKPFHAGKAAMDGILAAELASEGFEAATDLLDAENGLSRALIQDGETRIENVEFSEGLSLLKNVFKAYACCRASHPHMDAARRLAPEIGGARVKRVDAQANPSGMHVANRLRPANGTEGKFSIPFVLALGLTGHSAAASDFGAERVADERLMEIVERVELHRNPAVERYASVLDVELEDGRKLHAEVPVALGNPENPMDWDDMKAKFDGLAEPVLGPKAETLYEALRTFEQPGRMAEALNLVSGE